MSYSRWHLVEFAGSKPPVFFHAFPPARLGIRWTAISFGEGLVFEASFSWRVMIRTFAPPSEVRSFQDFVPRFGVVLCKRLVGEPSFSGVGSHGSWRRRLPPGVSRSSVSFRARTGRGMRFESVTWFQAFGSVSHAPFIHPLVALAFLSSVRWFLALVFFFFARPWGLRIRLVSSRVCVFLPSFPVFLGFGSCHVHFRFVRVLIRTSWVGCLVRLVSSCPLGSLSRCPLGSFPSCLGSSCLRSLVSGSDWRRFCVVAAILARAWVRLPSYLSHPWWDPLARTPDLPWIRGLFFPFQPIRDRLFFRPPPCSLPSSTCFGVFKRRRVAIRALVSDPMVSCPCS